MKNLKAIITILIVLVVVGLGFKILKQRKTELKKAETAQIIPSNVQVQKLSKEHVILTIPALGLVKSNINSTVSTKVTGRVINVLRDKGDFVKRGELLAEIDNEDIKAKRSSVNLEIINTENSIQSIKGEIQALKIKLNNLLDTHRRTKELLDVQGASIEQYNNEESLIASTKSQLNSTENLLKTTENKIEILKNNLTELNNLLTYTKVISPVSGIISEKLINTGEVAYSGKPLFKLSSNKDLYIEVKIPADIKANKAYFNDKSYKLIPLYSTVNGIRLYKLDGAFDDLTEGEYVDVKLVTFEGEEILLPHEAILNTDKDPYIFLLDGNNKVTQLSVKIKGSGSEGVVLNEDLDNKTIILAMPDILLKIAAGNPINIINR
ncbi:efflux RND transporter periplasmic adaptor subunit [Deferribacteraceae bacterium V6Fe1]|nr:efflux RND transporter periplasmic adaptor subunit [Deferribacteraceae bacterium V6Fe1]